MNTNQAHYALIQAAASLARCEALPSAVLEDWPAWNIGRRRVCQLLEQAEDRLRALAQDVRDAADIQAAEISRLRAAIDRVVRENHPASTGIVGLHIVAGEVG